MCNPNDRLQYRDVLSKSYLGPLNTMQLALNSFMEEIITLKYKFIGPVFFSIQLDEAQENARTTIYVPLLGKPTNISEGFFFQSYFSIGRAFSAYIAGDFENQISPVNNSLVAKIDASGFKPVTPLFIVIGGEKESGFCLLKVGVREQE